MPKALRSACFYGETVVLEFEPDFSYLGLRILPTGHSFHLEVIVPGYAEIENSYPFQPKIVSERWRYRTAMSSGSARGLLSGFESRLHTAARFGRPASRAREAVAKLVTIAVVTGQDTRLLRRVLKKHGMKHPHAYSAQFRKALLNAIKLPGQRAIHACRLAVGTARSQH